MDSNALAETVQELMAPGKGLLAMDESNPTCNKRFAALNIAQTAEMRRIYRELIVTAPGLGDYISGAILFDETIRQKLNNGSTFVDALNQSGIVPGIKVDMGTRELAGFPAKQLPRGWMAWRVA